MEVRDTTSGTIPLKKNHLYSFVDSCRICMARNTNLSNIFNTESENIIEEVLFCTGVDLKQENGWPTKICIQCLKDLSVAFKFKTSCLLADKTFRKLIGDTQIKSEVHEDSDIDYEGVIVYENELEDDYVDELKQENGWPTKICIQCLKDLSVAFKFKTSCLLADKTFRKLIGDTQIKSEVHEDSDIDYEGVIVYENELEDDYVDEVKEEVKFEPEQIPIVNRKPKVKKEVPVDSTQTRRRVGRPKSSKTGSRPLKKFKFKKLHCEPCDIKFENKQQCDEHKKTVHKDSDHWVCEICGKLFAHRASHYTHIKSHLPPKYGCDQCDYKTWHKHDLVKHIRIHTGIKLYQCEYCTASYYTSSNLTGHIRRNHMKQRPFECTTCHMTFFDRTKLNRHMDSHNEVKRFECEVCHACFTRRCYWKKHLLRQHDIDVPAQRPGRQKTNAVIGEDLIDRVNFLIAKEV